MTHAYAEVIGDPIAHSKSPILHGYWIDALGLDATYRATFVTLEQLPAYFDARKADPAWRGCNITLPHKIAALDHVDDRGNVRDTIGAINLAARVEDGAVIGTNTDAGGFYDPISAMEWSGAHVAVIGSGGAARAVLFALSRVGVGRVTLVARNPLKGAALLATFGLKGDVVALDAKLPPAAMLVNASPLGMTGQEPLTIDLDPLPEAALVYDLVYAPLETPLLAQARARGLDTVDGLEMLIGQAALAFEILFDAEPPRDEERDAELRAMLTA